MKTYAGIDLHSNNSYVVIIDQDENVLFSRRIANDVELFLKIFQQHKKTLVAAVVESTYNWYWLADGLREAGYKTKLAMPNKIKQYSGLKYTGDKHDARHLAKLELLGLIESGYIMEPALRNQREISRMRMRVVQQQTQTILRFQSVFERYYSTKLSADKIRKMNSDDFVMLCPDKNILICAQELHSVLQAQMKSVDMLEKEILGQLKTSDDFKRLKCVPGIGEVLAHVALSEIGNISRFTNAGNFASYCRLVKSERISNNKKKGENNSKNGNPYLRWVFIEAANAAIRYYEPIRKFYQKKVSKCPPVVARSAVAHKLARAAYYVLKDKVHFDMEKAFG